MKIAIIGTGALGGWYASLLSEAGHEVHCLARSDFKQINENGLKIRHLGKERIIKVTSATSDANDIGLCDLVIITLKSTSNHALPELLKPTIGSRTIALTLQNGMGNVETLSRYFSPDQIVAGLCFVCINRTAPAVIETTLAGYVRMAAAFGQPNNAVRTCVSIFQKAGINCQAELSLESVLWKKLCWNIPFNGLSITGGGITTDCILANPVLKQRALSLMKETQAASLASGHGFDDTHIQRQFTVTLEMGAYRPSSMIDYLNRKDVEIEAIWGEPLRRGQLLGVYMPEIERLRTEIIDKVKQIQQNKKIS